MSQLQQFDKKATASFTNEPEVEAYSDLFLRGLGFDIKHRKTGRKDIDKCWPSKTATAKSSGAPDVLVYASATAALPFCVWENKAPAEPIDVATSEAKFYIEGLHQQKPLTPNLPRLAAGFNGKTLRLAYFNHEKKWVPVRLNGSEIVDQFPRPDFISNGISATGNFLAAAGTASSNDLRKALPALKTLYRSIPILASGRRPIDFTVALLTLRMLVEMNQDWGAWAEQPSLVADATSTDQAIGERFSTLVKRTLGDPALKSRYGDIFQFKEQSQSKEEVAFSFEDCLGNIPKNAGFFVGMFNIIDALPPLHGADFDVFGEVYQSIGDDATKKALGEFFTGRHIISAVVPVLFERAGAKSFEAHFNGKDIADIACGTGGFLTETLRFVRKKFSLTEEVTRTYAAKAFYGYDLSHANASRARVNMYFAGDGFSVIVGGVDSLGKSPLPRCPKNGFDFILTNPPYGQSSQYQRLEEAFIVKMISLLKPGAGWGLIVLPTGVLENPRSAALRKEIMRKARITDVISLPPHAFAPYTKQRTAIVILECREKEIPEADWDDVVKNIENEEISFFIVDNDGFANSDKRYPTSRVGASGEWLHDDLAPWVDSTGKYSQGKLFNALIKKQNPGVGENEFGEKLGNKYGVFNIRGLSDYSSQRDAEKGRGISLLPDVYLRPSFAAIPLKDFISWSDNVLKCSKGLAIVLPSSLSDELKSILRAPVSFSNGTGKPITEKIQDYFSIKKGDQGLTEEIIYNQQNNTGLPVYGGGEALPRFRIDSGAITKKASSITVHNGPAIIVAMDGSSGAVRVILSGSFVCNHHASVLTLTNPKKKKIDLYFVAQQIEGGLRSLASNKEGSATLTMDFLKDFVFETSPNPSDIKEISKRRKALSSVRDRLF